MSEEGPGPSPDQLHSCSDGRQEPATQIQEGRRKAGKVRCEVTEATEDSFYKSRTWLLRELVRLYL